MRIPSQALIAAFAIVALLETGIRFRAVWIETNAIDDRSVMADLRRIVDENPNADVMMGVGQWDRYDMSFYRPVLLFRGQPYLLDYAALMDMKLSGLPMPAATKEKIANDFRAIWLVPAGDEPFSLESIYTLYTPAFDDTFRQAFLRNFHRSSTRGAFDLWTHVDVSPSSTAAISGTSKDAN